MNLNLKVSIKYFKKIPLNQANLKFKKDKNTLNISEIEYQLLYVLPASYVPNSFMLKEISAK